MNRLKSSTCIVASTLPAALLAIQASTLNIKKIIAMSSDLQISYQYIKKSHPSINITCAPSGFFSRNLFFLLELLKNRLRKDNIIFYHECGLVALDLLVMLIKPFGFYFPQVTMEGFEEIKFDKFPTNNIIRLLNLLGLVEHFRFYICPQIGSGPPEYVISIKKYPLTIKSMEISYSRDLILQSINLSCEAEVKNKILFIIGKSFIDDEVQINYFLRLISIAHSKGYICHVKDHPNPLYRLNIISDNSLMCDPLIPSELMDRDYKFAVGLSSSGLLTFTDRAISILYLIKEILPADRILLSKHFEKSMPNNGIRYISTFEEFTDLL